MLEELSKEVDKLLQLNSYVSKAIHTKLTLPVLKEKLDRNEQLFKNTERSLIENEEKIKTSELDIKIQQHKEQRKHDRAI